MFKDPKTASVKKRADEAYFKLKVVRPAVDHGNRAAEKQYNVKVSMVRKWRKQKGNLHQVKKTRGTKGNAFRLMLLIMQCTFSPKNMVPTERGNPYSCSLCR